MITLLCEAFVFEAGGGAGAGVALPNGDGVKSRLGGVEGDRGGVVGGTISEEVAEETF
jgi:hypothetical protein